MKVTIQITRDGKMVENVTLQEGEEHRRQRFTPFKFPAVDLKDGLVGLTYYNETGGEDYMHDEHEIEQYVICGGKRYSPFEVPNHVYVDGEHSQTVRFPEGKYVFKCKDGFKNPVQVEATVRILR